MSYDMQLVINTGGTRLVPVTECKSPTYNLGPMFALAIGAGIRSLDGRIAADIKPILAKAGADMRRHPAKYRKLTPENGWGSYEGALETIQWLHEMCEEHPLATVQI